MPVLLDDLERAGGVAALHQGRHGAIEYGVYEEAMILVWGSQGGKFQG